MAADFQRIAALLEDGIAASYLLALDSGRTETANAIARAKTANLADGADDEFINEQYGPNESDNEAARIGLPDLNLQLRFDVPPAEALDYFKRKKVVRRDEWDDVRHDAHDAAFTVSGIQQDKVLQGFYDEIVDALAEGKSQDATIKRFKEILAGASHEALGDWHQELIFRQNMQRAYGIGRRRALEETAEDLPFWTYNAVLDDRTRPSHRVLDGLTLPHDSDFWKEHFPPWGWACRCSVSSSYALPDDYNPQNPSGMGEIAYDKDELPVKATYETGVLDLGAGKMTGVPPQARLSELRDFAKLRQQEALYEPPAELLAKEDDIRFNKKETVAFYDAEGKLLFTKTGLPDKVTFSLTDTQVDLLRKSTATHNHPSLSEDRNNPIWRGLSFSLEDVQMGVKTDVAELRIVSPGYRYSLRPSKTGWSKQFKNEKDLANLYKQVSQDVEVQLYDAVIDGGMTLDEANLELQHEIWTRIARRYKMKYRRLKLKS